MTDLESTSADRHVESGGTDLVLAPHFVDVDVDAIVPSKTNPRKVFDAAALKELAESMATHGLAQPILVRPIDVARGIAEHASYELVAGERRLRAARLLKWPTIPCLVRALDDRQALELQVVENLQRADLHPLEEAEGYELLMKQHGYMAEDLAAKVGKSKAYIYARLKLTALCQKARKAFYDGKLDASRALLIARIPHDKLQEEALEEIAERDMSYRNAVGYVHRKFMLRLADAPFKADDPMLYPPAGPCTTCPKRTGNQPELFNDVSAAEVCTDTACFATKKAKHAAGVIAAARANGRAVIDGKLAKQIFPYEHSTYPYAGYVAKDHEEYIGNKGVKVSTLAKGAKIEPVLVVHPGSKDVIELFELKPLIAAAKAAGTIPKAASASTGSDGDAQMKARQRAAKIESAYRARLLAEVVSAAESKMTSADWQVIAGAMISGLDHDTQKRLYKGLEWADDLLPGYSGPTPALTRHLATLADGELALLMLRCALIGEAHKSVYSEDKAPKLHAAAERFGVDANALKATVRSEMAPKPKVAKTAVVKKASSSTVPVKYRNEQTGDTWSGRGKAPKWIEGKDRAPFVVQPEKAAAC